MPPSCCSGVENGKKGGTIWEKQCGKQVGDPHRLIGTAGCETRMPSGVRGVGESFPYSIRLSI